MPYIKLSERPKFAHEIEEILGILGDKNDTMYTKGEYFGYFVNRVCRRYLADPDYTQNSFNSFFFNETKKKTLSNAADSIAARINRADPLGSAGELNYGISAVLWAILGQCEGFEYANYGMRTYLRGIIEKVLDSIETVNTGSQRDMAMAFRRHLIIRGVLGDIVSETYRRATVPYEQHKMGENGDVWADGKLVLPEQSTELVVKE